MAKNKSANKKLADMKSSLRWYTDVISKTEMVDYSPVKGLWLSVPTATESWGKHPESLTSASNLRDIRTCRHPLLRQSIIGSGTRRRLRTWRYG